MPGLPGQLPKVPGVQGPDLQKGGLQLGPGGVQFRAPQFRGPQFRGLNFNQPHVDLGQLRMPNRAGPALPSAPLLPSQAVFRQKSWLPWWLAIVLPLLALLAVLLLMLAPKNVKVPD